MGRLRDLFRREPTRQELYQKLQRGLNLERDYQEWIERWERYGPADLVATPSLSLILVLVGIASDSDRGYWTKAAVDVGAVDVVWHPEPLNGLRLFDVLAGIPNRSPSEYMTFLHVTDRLSMLAPSYLHAAFATDAAVIYGDEDRIDSSGRRFAPWFKPDYSEDLFICQNGFGRAVFFRRSVFRDMSLPDQAADLDSFIYGAALAGGVPLHCPGILLHVAGDPAVDPKPRVFALSGSARLKAIEALIAERSSLRAATVEPSGAYEFLRLRHPMPEPLPTVSIIIPTRDRRDLLEACIRSLDEATNYPDKEIVVIDNDSVEQTTKDYFAALSRRADVQIIPSPGPFNYPRLINLGARHARGKVLVTLNNDIEAFEPDWLNEMVAQASRAGVGVVGCLLLYPDHSVQHAGVIVGLSGVAGHMYADAKPGDPGYCGRILVTQDLSAVTGACHVMWKFKFDSLGGLDERHLAVAYNDIDFCLRVREAGMRVIYTPHARLRHRHSASRGSDVRPERLISFTWEREYMRTRWAKLIFDDPFFNPNLSLSGKRGRLATAPRPRIFKKD